MDHTPPNAPSRRLLLVVVLAVVALLVPIGAGELASAASAPVARHQGHGPAVKPTIVLVHGDWADASGWSGVISRLQRKGYTVVAPPNQLRGPATDAPYLAAFLATIPGPIVLVGHSYGGFVITNAATGNQNVEALVYVDAFVPDDGETLGGLAAAGGGCLDPATAFNAVPEPGGVVDLYLRVEANPPYPGFADCFANGVPKNQAAVLAAVQRPAAVAQLGEPSGPPAWASIPAWALVGTADRVIPPDQQEAMANRAGATISTVRAGHLSLVSRPDAVTRVIETAADATG